MLLARVVVLHQIVNNHFRFSEIYENCEMVDMVSIKYEKRLVPLDFLTDQLCFFGNINIFEVKVCSDLAHRFGNTSG